MVVVLDQPLRAGVRLMNLALRAIAGDEPVVAQGSCVLLLRDTDALRRLLFEALQLPGSNCQVCEDLKSHKSSFRRAIPRRHGIAGIASLLLGLPERYAMSDRYRIHLMHMCSKSTPAAGPSGNLSDHHWHNKVLMSTASRKRRSS